MPDAPHNDSPSRRRFLRRLALAAGGAAGAGTLLAGCGGDNSGDGGNGSGGNASSNASASPDAENQCVPPQELSQAAKQGRQRYGYVAQTPEQGKQCDNCQFWVPAEAGATCGGCRLFAGPVHPQGYCTAYLAG